MGRAEIELVVDGEVALTEPIGPLGLRVGRAPGNDLVVHDPAVSGHHLAVAWAGDGLVVSDLASRNGTTVDGRRVGAAAVPVDDGATLVLGERVTLRIRRRPDAPPATAAWELEVGGVARVPLRRDRMWVGSADDADLRLPDGPARAGLVLLAGDEVRLATDDDDVPLVPDAPTPLGGTTLTLRRVDAALAATVPVGRTTYPYALEAAVGGPAGTWAVVSDPETGRAHRVDTENRAVLLWVLGRRWRDDADRRDGDRGWCSDDEVLAALWGRQGAGADPTRIRVLLCRLRRELADAGLDGACLEKRQGHVRVRLAAVTLVGSAG